MLQGFTSRTHSRFCMRVTAINNHFNIFNENATQLNPTCLNPSSFTHSCDVFQQHFCHLGHVQRRLPLSHFHMSHLSNTAPCDQNINKTRCITKNHKISNPHVCNATHASTKKVQFSVGLDASFTPPRVRHVLRSAGRYVRNSPKCRGLNLHVPAEQRTPPELIVIPCKQVISNWPAILPNDGGVLAHTTS